MRLIKCFIITIVLLLISCNDITDCLFDIKPNIVDNGFVDGIVSQNYEDYITVDIQNTNSSNYEIDNVEIEGNLPSGITSFFNGRNVYFEGIPTTIGTYDFNVKITVLYVNDYDNENNDDHLCGNTTSKSYSIKIY